MDGSAGRKDMRPAWACSSAEIVKLLACFSPCSDKWADLEYPISLLMLLAIGEPKPITASDVLSKGAETTALS